MTTQTMLILLWYLISIFFVVILHETIHFIFAIFFKLKPTLTISKLGTPTVRYKNDNQYSKIFVVAISAPLILTILAFLLPENGYLVMMKIMCGVNFFNLFPFTTDGEVALYSLLHIWRKNEKK